MTARISPSAFARTAAILWGPRYGHEAARALAVSRSTIQNYVTGARPIPYNMAGKLRRMLAAHIAEAYTLDAELEVFFTAGAGLAVDSLDAAQ